MNCVVSVGAYTAEERQRRIERFLAKRSHRVWTKKVKYDVRKNFADSRVRVKGRFVRKEDEEFLMKELTDRQSIEDGGSVGGGGDEGKIRSGGGRNTPLNMISSTSGTVVTSPQRHVAAALMSLTNSST